MKIFISHSSKDSEIVGGFIDLFINTELLTTEQIFASSIDGTNIPTGLSWRNQLKVELKKSRIIVLIMTENYRKSEVCQNEMGAAWMVDDVQIFPFVVDKNHKGFIPKLEEDIQYEILSEETSLERMKDKIIDLFHASTNRVDSARWNTKKKEFIQKIKTYITQPPPGIIPLADDKLQRGKFTKFVVDSSLSRRRELNNIELYEQLESKIAQVKNSSTIDLKYNYLGHSCAHNWLTLARHPKYGHNTLKEIISAALDEIIDHCEFQGKEIDMISLGSGGGDIDKDIIGSFQSHGLKLINYYPLDLSFDLLQKATYEILDTDWLRKDFGIKPIHGDFNELVSYHPVYGYDDSVNFLSLLGFTFGDFNEGRFLENIKDGMNTGDFLVLDARLHDLSINNNKDIALLPDQEKNNLLMSYNHELNNRFAFGPLELLTFADFDSVNFQYEINHVNTVIPKAINIITYCANLQTTFRSDRRAFHRNKVNLTSTTVYSYQEIRKWFNNRPGFDLIWSKEVNSIGLFLLKRI